MTARKRKTAPKRRAKRVPSPWVVLLLGEVSKLNDQVAAQRRLIGKLLMALGPLVDDARNAAERQAGVEPKQIDPGQQPGTPKRYAGLPDDFEIRPLHHDSRPGAVNPSRRIP